MTETGFTLRLTDRDDLHLLLDAFVTRRKHLRGMIAELDGAECAKPLTERFSEEAARLLIMQEQVLDLLAQETDRMLTNV